MKPKPVGLPSTAQGRAPQAALLNRKALLCQIEKFRKKDSERAEYLEKIAIILDVGDRVNTTIYLSNKSIGGTSTVLGYKNNRRGIVLLVQPDGENKNPVEVVLEAKGIEYAKKANLLIEGDVIQIIPELVEGFLESHGYNDDYLTRVIRKIN